MLMILVGLTYAYFLTKITGNTNEKSISVSTANLELAYGDGTIQILKNDTPLEPSSNAIGTKDFTVTNNGNSKTNYVVVIEDVVIKNTIDDTTTTFNSNDFRYTLTCTKKDGTTCDGVSTQSVFPITGGIMVGNSIDVDDVQSYVLTLWYIDTGIDQSKDMGKSLQAKVNIKDISQITNPYSSNKNSLAYNIIENAKNKTNGTELLSSPKTQVAEETSYSKRTGKYENGQELDMSTQSYWYYGSTYNDAQPWNGGSGNDYVSECSDTIVGKYISYPTVGESWYVKSCKSSTVAIVGVEIYDYEKNIAVAPDDYGISYYYRGNVIDNYINFAGMCWRAVRISGDGSIKLILEDQDSTCATSDGNWNISTATGGTTKTGNFGYTEYALNTLTASDGTQNSNTKSLMNYLNGETNNATSMATAFKNFQTGALANYLDKLKTGDWCLNDTAYASENDNTTALTSQEIIDKQVKRISFYYDSYVRLKGKTAKESSFKCNGTNINKFAGNTDMYVGTLTADEIVYAGGKINVDNSDYYLMNDYQKLNNLRFWSLSTSNFFVDYDDAFFVNYSGSIYNGQYIMSALSFRPAVQLKSNIQISGGSGTKENPYIVE